jgi:hypothetical protein
MGIASQKMILIVLSNILILNQMQGIPSGGNLNKFVAVSLVITHTSEHYSIIKPLLTQLNIISRILIVVLTVLQCKLQYNTCANFSIILVN